MYSISCRLALCSVWLLSLQCSGKSTRWEESVGLSNSEGTSRKTCKLCRLQWLKELFYFLACVCLGHRFEGVLACSYIGHRSTTSSSHEVEWIPSRVATQFKLGLVFFIIFQALNLLNLNIMHNKKLSVANWFYFIFNLIHITMIHTINQKRDSFNMYINVIQLSMYC